MASRVVNIVVPEALLHEVERAREREHRSRSEFFREAARWYLEHRKSSRAPRAVAGRQDPDRAAWDAATMARLALVWNDEREVEYEL